MKKNQIILIIIGVLVLIGFVSSFSYWFQFVKPEVEVSPSTEKVADLCAEFPKIEREVSCEEAIEIALEGHPGEVISIDKAVFQSRPDFWIANINLKNPIKAPNITKNKIEVLINQDGEIFAVSVK